MKDKDYLAPLTKKRLKQNIITPAIAANLDRTKSSLNDAMRIIASTSQALGKDLRNVNLSRSTKARHRNENRKKLAKIIKQKFNNKHPLTLHWDGKLLPNITGRVSLKMPILLIHFFYYCVIVFTLGREKEDRIAVLVSGDNVEQLLGVPKVERATGCLQAKAATSQLIDWNLRDSIGSLCFDTTSSNTGLKSGACVEIERELERNLLWLACRHHIFELLLKEAFIESIKTSTTGPDVQLFKRFRDNWHKIDTSILDVT